MISDFEEMVYSNQIASCKSFWSSEGKDFHHSCFRDAAERELNNIWQDISPKLEAKLRMRKLKIKSVCLSPEGNMVKFNIVLPGEQWGANRDEELIFFVPPVTGRGTFLLENNGKIIEKAFILNLISSPGLYFTDYGAFIRPYRYGYWIKFFKTITDDIRKNLCKNEELLSLIEKFGCVELKCKKHFVTPLFLHLLGISDKDITDIYKEKGLTEEILIKIKNLYYDGECRDDLIFLIDPKKKKDFKDDKEILAEFKREILERFNLDKTGRWQIKRRFSTHGIKSEDSEDLTLNDIKGITEIVLSKKPVTDDLYCLSNNMVLQIGDYLEETLLKILKKTGRTLQEYIKNRTLSFEDFINFLRNRFIPLLERSIKNLFALSPLSQVLPGTNILNDVNYQKRITRCGPGGISKERSEDFKTRDIHSSYYGRICPLDTPQSDKIGLVLSLTENARINNLAILETPYLRVKDWEITDELLWLTPDEEFDKYIAFGDQRNDIKNNEVFARRGKEELVKKELKDIAYIDYSPLQPFSIIPQLIPFLFCNDPGRMVVAVSLFKQSIPLKERELPFIYTGMEEKVAGLSSQLLFEDEEQKGTLLSDLQTSIFGVLKGREAIEPLEIDGKKLLAEPPSSKDGSFAPGVNLLCAYVPWKGYNFEDAIIISETAAKKLTSRHVDREIELQINKNMIFRKDNPFYSEQELGFINDDGIVNRGTSVKPGDLLISAVKKDEGFKDWMKDFTLSIFGRKAEGYKDMSLKVPEGICGIVKEIEKSTNLIKFKILDERPAGAGDKISNRYGGKGVISLILPDEEMPYFEEDNEKKTVEILLNPLGVTSRMNLGQIMETHLGLCAKKTGGRFRVNPSGEIIFYSDNHYKEKINNILKTAEDISGKIKSVFDLLSLKDKVELKDPLNNNSPLDNPVTAGYQYFMKLIHQSEEKFYFRTEGDYSLITAQPLKGKKLGGGQKAGEMEGWAYQSHRAFNLLEEMFTVRSDDLTAREFPLFSDRGTPESVKTFIYYMRGLCIDITLSDGTHDITDKILSDEYSTYRIKKVSLNAAEDDKIKRWANVHGEVKKSSSTSIDDMAEESEGLYSSHIFGEWRHGKVSNIKDMRTKMGYIKLPCPVSNPLCEGKEIILLPVIPFSCRPAIEMNGEIIKHDLNRHYEKILHLKYEIEHYDTLQKKRKKTIKELHKEISYAVCNLFNNGKKAYPFVDSKGIALKSFITLLEKKEGHFRKNMLGKRIDYSGRGVIAVDPELNIDEVYIPCSETAGKTVILNRQPTLHRMSVMAFRNIYNPSDNDYRSKSKVIFLNPLVTGGFGADFDGDTMAFYLPSGEKALEDAGKMFPSGNFLSPANGKVHFNLGQDIKLGIAYANKKTEFKTELLKMMGLDENRGDVTKEDFENFIITLLSESKDTEILKNVLSKIFYYSTISGTTFSLFDLPSDISKDFELKNLPENNTLFMVYPAKARGDKKQIVQLCYRKGEVARIHKAEFEYEIESYYLKGLTTGEYFYSCYGSIKTHVDKKLSTGHAGELARHLIEAVYDCVIKEEDCKTEDGIEFTPGVYNECITGRYLSGKSIALNIKDLEQSGILPVKLRSPVTCKTKNGICQMCYGIDLSTGKLPDIGTTVGIIAAQTIGEKGTQFQMKTVHSGGAKITEKEQDIDEAGRLFYSPGKNKSLPSLLSWARNIYPSGYIKDIHFEVIFKSMMSGKVKPAGLKSLVTSEGFLRSLSFGRPFSILKRALKKGITDTVEGLKKNLLFMINPEKKGEDSNGREP